MRRAATVFICGSIMVACGGSKINSYEDGMTAQVEVMEDMIAVLQGVNDTASAEAAAGEIEALGKRLGDIAKQVAELPTPSAEEMQAITESFREDGLKFQQQAPAQMLKLAQYPTLQEAWLRAMEHMQ